jgi:hypothetical protein
MNGSIEFVDIILLLVIGLIILYVARNNTLAKPINSSAATEKFKSNILDSNKDYDYLDDLLKFQSDNQDIKRTINTNFTEIQFHNDYRDVTTAFNNISPSQRQVFNQVNYPAKMTNPSVQEVSPMVKDFVREVNKNLMTQVTESRNSNSGWDENIPDKNIKSGHDKVNESLGLPTSIYNKSAKKDKIKLIAIDHVEQYTTTNETRYVCFLILQKMNVKDQMIVKIAFVINNHDINVDRNFFDVGLDSDKRDKKVIIEEIFIIGYLSNSLVNNTSILTDNFYNFAKAENNDMLDQKVIMKELRKKFKERSAEMNNFYDMLEPEGRKLHNELPHLRNYNTYQATQTIFDDFNDNIKYT